MDGLLEQLLVITLLLQMLQSFFLNEGWVSMFRERGEQLVDLTAKDFVLGSYLTGIHPVSNC